MDTSNMSPRDIVAGIDSIAETAETGYEAFRRVASIHIHSVPTMYRVIAEAYSAASAMGTVASNMADTLGGIDTSDLYDARDGYNTPTTNLEDAVAKLRAAQTHAAALNRALQDAQNAISGIGHREENGQADL